MKINSTLSYSYVVVVRLDSDTRLHTLGSAYLRRHVHRCRLHRYLPTVRKLSDRYVRRVCRFGRERQHFPAQHCCCRLVRTITPALCRYMFPPHTNTHSPLFARPMFHNLGIGSAMSIFGGIAVLAIPIPFLLMKYSPRLRRSSVWAANLSPP